MYSICVSGQDIDVQPSKRQKKDRTEKTFTINIEEYRAFLSNYASYRSKETNQIPFIDMELKPMMVEAIYHPLVQDQSLPSYKISNGEMTGYIYYAQDGIRGAVFLGNELYMIEPIGEGEYKMTKLERSTYDCLVDESEIRPKIISL